MTKTQITALAHSLVSKHLPSEWKFEWNKRKSALGVCNYAKKKIFLSEYFIGRVPTDELKDTILHEIAHALTYIRHGQRGHGPVWKRVCVEIGAKPVRCHEGEIKNETFRYKIKCPSCGKESGRHRFNKSKLTQLKNGHSWFPCRCCKSRMDVYDNGKKIVDGNAAKRPTATQVKKMSNKELIAEIRQMGKMSSHS